MTLLSQTVCALHITVHHLSGETYELDREDTCTVADVKHELAGLTGVQETHMQLVFNSTRLKDHYQFVQQSEGAWKLTNGRRILPGCSHSDALADSITLTLLITDTREDVVSTHSERRGLLRRLRSCVNLKWMVKRAVDLVALGVLVKWKNAYDANNLDGPSGRREALFCPSGHRESTNILAANLDELLYMLSRNPQHCDEPMTLPVYMSICWLSQYGPELFDHSFDD